MSKKSRKARTRVKRLATNQQSINKTAQSSIQVEEKRQIAKQTPPEAAPAPNILQAGRYDYVKRDLINIGVVVTVLLLILIVLTFVPGLKT